MVSPSRRRERERLVVPGYRRAERPEERASEPRKGWRGTFKIEISNPKSGPGETGGDRRGREGVVFFLLGLPRIQTKKLENPKGAPNSLEKGV
jgi:hypothetical protein